MSAAVVIVVGALSVKSYISMKTYVVGTHLCASNEYPQHMFLSRNKETIYLIPTLI